MLLFGNPKNHVKKMRHCAYLPTNESRTLFFSNSANLKRLCVKSKAANYEENLTVPRQLMPKEGKIYAKTTQLLCAPSDSKNLPEHLLLSKKDVLAIKLGLFKSFFTNFNFDLVFIYLSV